MRNLINNRNLLRVDAAFLFLAGFPALLADFAGYYFGTGLLGEQLIGDPLVISAAEAHGLAVIMSFALMSGASSHDQRFFHYLAVAVHLLLGGVQSNFLGDFFAE